MKSTWSGVRLHSVQPLTCSSCRVDPQRHTNGLAYGSWRWQRCVRPRWQRRGPLGQFYNITGALRVSHPHPCCGLSPPPTTTPFIVQRGCTSGQSGIRSVVKLQVAPGDAVEGVHGLAVLGAMPLSFKVATAELKGHSVVRYVLVDSCRHGAQVYACLASQTYGSRGPGGGLPSSLIDEWFNLPMR